MLVAEKAPTSETLPAAPLPQARAAAPTAVSSPGPPAAITRNLFLVQAPLQAFNAIEAVDAFGLNPRECRAVWFHSASERNDRQTLEILRRGEWGAVDIVGYGDKSFSSWRQRFSQVRALAAEHSPCEHLFVGDYAFDLMRHFANSVRARRKTSLDDGNSTLLIDRARRERGRPYFLPRGFSGRAKHFVKSALCGMRSRVADDLDYFTIYQLDSAGEDSRADVTTNRYEYFRRRLLSAHQSDETLFLGTLMSEKDLMTEGAYLDYVGRALECIGDRSIVYLPHRKEDPAKLAAIEKRFGVRIGDAPMPFEYRLCYSGTLPKRIAGFFTSAFDTSRVLVGDRVPIRAFWIDPLDCVPSIRAEIAEIYRYYESYAEGDFELVKKY